MNLRLSLLVLIFLLPRVRADDWSAWRGPLGNGVSAEKKLPVKWSATQNVRWKTPLPGVGVSAPIVTGDRVFITASDGRRNDRLHLICFDRATGKQLWDARFFGSTIPEGEFAPGGMAVPTPASDGQRVYALFGTGDLVCLDVEGRPVWIASLTETYGPFRNRWGMGSSPLLIDGTLVVQVDHWGQSYLIGLEPESGRQRWRTERDASVNWCSPVPALARGKPQIVVAGSYRVQGYDPRNGAELWTVRGMQMQCIPSPVADGDMVYAVSGRKGNSLAIRLDDARGDLTESHVKWSKSRGAPYVPSGLVYEGRYYLIDDGGIATCMDAKNGAVVWQERVPGKYHASLVAGAGNVYFTNMEGVVTVVRAGREFQAAAKNLLGEGVVATPALAHGQLFLRGEKHLFCIEEK